MCQFFRVIGLGGKGAAPEKLYVVPLKDISNPFTTIGELERYEKNIEKNFFFDFKSGCAEVIVK